MRRLACLAVCVGGCGPVVPVPDEEGSTTMAPEQEPEDDDDPVTSSTTVSTSPTTTPLPSTSASPSTSAPGTMTVASETATTGPIDDCVDLELVGGPIGPGITAGSTIGNDDDFEFCEAGIGGADYVISWTAPAAALYHFTLAGSDYDTVLGIFPPECGGIQHTCNDDCIDVSSYVEYPAEDGEEIYIVIDGYAGTVGNFVLNIGVGSEDCGGGGPTTGHDTSAFISGGE